MISSLLRWYQHAGHGYDATLRVNLLQRQLRCLDPVPAMRAPGLLYLSKLIKADNEGLGPHAVLFQNVAISRNTFSTTSSLRCSGRY